jgi:sugar/nucleoside kinase (ribokinase family)
MKKYQVIGIGSALLDITFEVDDKLLSELGLKKGEMQLIDKERSKEILKKLENYPVKISPGGSVSNTIAGVATLGGSSAFIGKIGNDSHGKLYEEKTNESGIASFLSKHENEITGHAITFITPDFERSFAVHLGASLFFKKEDIIEDLIKKSKILHLEGYQLANKELNQNIFYSAKIAKENNLLISLDLSDSGLVKNNLALFKEFIKEYVDIVFANESEAEVFTGKKEKEALNEIFKLCSIAVVKLGEKGSLIKSKDKIYEIPSYKTKIINTNGAGDMYAAGILYGIANNLDLEQAGKIASYSASLVVAKQEARYGKGLREKMDRFISNNGI